MPACVAAGWTDSVFCNFLYLSIYHWYIYIHIDLLSQGPRPNLFSEVWRISTAALAPSCHLTLQFTDQCHLNVAILHSFLNGFIFHQRTHAHVTTQQSVANRGSKDNGCYVPWIWDYREARWEKHILVIQYKTCLFIPGSCCFYMVQGLNTNKGSKEGSILGYWLNQANLIIINIKHRSVDAKSRRQRQTFSSFTSHFNTQFHHAVENENHFFWLWKGPLLVGPIDLFVGKILCPFMQEEIRHSPS